MYKYPFMTTQPLSSSHLRLDTVRIQTRQVKESSHTLHDDLLETNGFPATLLISAGRVTLLSLLLLDLPYGLALSEGPGQTRAVSVEGGGSAPSGAKTHLCGSVCRWAGKAV